jgi:hypothetical protein
VAKKQRGETPLAAGYGSFRIGHRHHMEKRTQRLKQSGCSVVCGTAKPVPFPQRVVRSLRRVFSRTSKATPSIELYGTAKQTDLYRFRPARHSHATIIVRSSIGKSMAAPFSREIKNPFNSIGR